MGKRKSNVKTDENCHQYAKEGPALISLLNYRYYFQGIGRINGF